MFKLRSRNIRFMTEPVGEEVSSETNALGGTPVEPETPSEPSHPWDGYVEKFPEGVRGIARESFGDMEKNFNSRFQKVQEQYSPYKRFVDDKVDPQKLTGAYQFAEAFEQDPQGVVTALAKELGLTLAQAEQLAEETAQEQQEGQETDPRIAELEEKQQQFMQQIMEQQQAQEAERLNQEVSQGIEAELAAIDAKYGKMTDAIKQEVMRRAVLMIDQTGGPVSMEAAYLDLERFMSQLINAPRPGAIAPRVTPSGNSTPLTPQGKSPGQWTDKETKEAASAVYARMLAQGE